MEIELPYFCYWWVSQDRISQQIHRNDHWLVPFESCSKISIPGKILVANASKRKRQTFFLVIVSWAMSFGILSMRSQ